MNDERSGFAEVLGARLYFEARGAGRPLVLIHPEGLDRRIWDDQVPAFSERYEVVRYDRRGWGKTRVEDETRPTSEISDMESARQWLEEQPIPPAPHEDLRSLFDHLGIERANLLGWRDGGGVALDFAIEYPQRVDRLILVNTIIPSVGSPLQQEKVIDRGVQRAMEMQGLLEEALRNKELAAIVNWSLEDPSYATSTEETRRRLRGIYSDNASSILLPRGSDTSILDPPAGERLDEVKAPTLLITGEHDPDLREFDEALAAAIANARKVAIPDASATMNMDRPEEFNRIVVEFLEAP